MNRLDRNNIADVTQLGKIGSASGVVNGTKFDCLARQMKRGALLVGEKVNAIEWRLVLRREAVAYPRLEPEAHSQVEDLKRKRLVLRTEFSLPI